MNRVVARYIDGHVLKGTTVDFSASRETFHITDPISVQGWERTEVTMRDLKALFYVKDFDGDPAHVDKKSLPSRPPEWEQGVVVTFDDGEILVGTTQRYQGTGYGFFLVPSDAQSNNERCFVVEEATRDVCFM